MKESEMEQDVIACRLSEREQAQRADAAHQEVVPDLLPVEELPDFR